MGGFQAQVLWGSPGPSALRGLTCSLLLGQSLGLLSEVVQRPQPLPVPPVSGPYPDPKDLSEVPFGG